MRVSRSGVIALVVLGALALFFRLLPEPERQTGQGEAADAFVIRGARVFDGERFRRDVAVVVRSGRIAAVGPDPKLPAGAATVDGAGMTLLSGLIDAHVHAFGDALRDALRFGVTTALDMFTTPDMLGPARERREFLGEQEVADLWSSGILATAPGGHGTEYGIEIPTLQGPEEAPAFVAARLSEGSDYIKIVYDDGAGFGAKFPSIDRATLEALVETAHERGVLAVVHVSDLTSARHALEAGADGLVHLFGDAAVDREFVSLARQSGAFVIPTLSVLASVAGAGTGEALAWDERLATHLTPAQRHQLRSGFGRGRGATFLETAQANTAALHEAGVAVLAGTDAPNPGTAHGASLHGELELLVRAGLSNGEALAAATAVPARRFGLDDRGRIEAGMIADLVLVEGDPSSDITATRAIRRIWKDGREVSREIEEPSATAAPPAPDNATISQFESGEGDTGIRLEADFGFGWQLTTDRMRGGNSEASYERVTPGADGSAGALRVSGETRPGFAWPWAGVMFFPGAEPMRPVDFTGKTELVFHARGDGGSYNVMLFSGPSSQGMPAWTSFETAGEWQRIAIPFSEFPGADPARLRAIAFTAGPGTGTFRFDIDNVAVR